MTLLRKLVHQFQRIFDRSPIDRVEYLENTICIFIITFLLIAPHEVMEYYAKHGMPISKETELLFALIALTGAMLWLYLGTQNVFKRARDLEQQDRINRFKWIFLAYFPIIAWYSRFYLLLKK